MGTTYCGTDDKLLDRVLLAGQGRCFVLDCLAEAHSSRVLYLAGLVLILPRKAGRAIATEHGGTIVCMYRLGVSHNVFNHFNARRRTLRNHLLQSLACRVKVIEGLLVVDSGQVTLRCELLLWQVMLSRLVVKGLLLTLTGR